MPPVTPRATFMIATANALGVVSESLIQNFGSLLGGTASFRDLPLLFACADFILRDTARFAGIGLNHRRSAGLQLPGATGGDQNVAIVTVEAFDQFHGFSPPGTGTQDFDFRKLPVFVLGYCS